MGAAPATQPHTTRRRASQQAVVAAHAHHRASHVTAATEETVRIRFLKCGEARVWTLAFGKLATVSPGHEFLDVVFTAGLLARICDDELRLAMSDVINDPRRARAADRGRAARAARSARTCSRSVRHNLPYKRFAAAKDEHRTLMLVLAHRPGQRMRMFRFVIDPGPSSVIDHQTHEVGFSRFKLPVTPNARWLADPAGRPAEGLDLMRSVVVQWRSQGGNRDAALAMAVDGGRSPSSRAGA